MVRIPRPRANEDDLRPVPVRRQALTYVLLGLVALLIAAPFLWLLSTSLKPMSEVLAFPPSWIPESFHPENYVRAWNAAPFDRFLANSLLYTLGSVALNLLLCSLAAYAFAWIDVPGRNLVFIAFLVTLMLPEEAAILPNYQTVARLGWIDTFAGLIVPGAASGFGTFLLRQSFKQIPKEVLEAARLDGAGHLRTLWHIVLPLSLPILVTFGLLAFLWKWNAYLWPLLVTNSQSMRTLPVGLAMLRLQEGVTEWNVLMAATAIVLAPVLILFVFAQRQIIEGVAKAGLKG